ncbi:N-acetyltransferase family protein [Longispora urticae]
MPMIIRPAVAADLPAVGDVDSRACQRAYAGLWPAEELTGYTPDNQTRGWTDRREREADSHHLLVAEDGGRVLGFTYVGPGLPGQDPDLGDLYSLFVDPDAQNAGIGRALLVAGQAVLTGLGYPRHLLWVAEANTGAVRFYERHGWRHDGVRSTAKGIEYLRYLYTP